MKTKVTWKGKMAFDGLSSNGFSIPLDTVPETGGEDGGVRPIELLLLGLAGCTAMDVISILKKKRQDVTDFEVQVVEYERSAEHPRVYTRIMLEYIVTGRGIDRNAVERAVELSEGTYCPANAMLNKVALIQSRITVLEAEAA
jgi:putative redox protein